MEGLLAVDLSPFLHDPTSKEALFACQTLLNNLKSTSCLIVRDPRVHEEDNISFLNLVEKYFSQPHEILMKDVRPDLSYQLGATPEFTEIPRDHHDVIEKLDQKNAAHKPQGPDPKWRFFWRIGERPTHTSFPELNSPPVIPKQFLQWTDVMDRWGTLMLTTVTTVAEMIAVASGLPKNALTDLMHQGPHLLAPTGSDLGRFNKLGTIFAGFHYDFNLLTIHGKSRFPGLFIWLRDGSRVQVRVPDGCLLLQAGKQLEWLTGGTVTAGFHEVVVVEDTLAAVERAKAAGNPLWRVSSTLFAHVNSDKILEPLSPYKTEETLANYPPTLAGKQAEEELKTIALQTPAAS